MGEEILSGVPHPGLGTPLIDADRLAALEELGLTRAADPGMERFAERVRDQLGVPVSLVSLVQRDQQVFPGMCGLPQPWAEARATPLSHSFCQHVVTSGEPLVVEDARLTPLVAENLATTEIGVVAYAGMPLTDSDGRVLGSLCAIDTEPRAWTAAELTVLADLAADCATELRLRLSQVDADRERARRDSIENALNLALHRSERLLVLAESLNESRTTADVRRSLESLVDRSTGMTAVRLHLRHEILLDDAPVVRSAVDRRVIQELHDDGGLVCAPLEGSSGVLGVVEIRWSVTRTLDAAELALLDALVAYTSQAVERAQLLEDRTSVAHRLQSAMLSPLPDVHGVEMAACYLPADAQEMVGGDWYDAYPLHHGPEDLLVLTVGDIIGHDINAAALMGQARWMLRQAAWDSPGAGPSAQVAALEGACLELGIPARGSAVLAHLRQDGGRWRMTWTNAGHPSPLVVAPDGSVTRLREHDMVFGYPELLPGRRLDHEVDLPSGTLLVLCTDGVVDRPGADPDEMLDELGRLAASVRGDGPQEVVDAITRRFADSDDDVVALVVQLP